MLGGFGCSLSHLQGDLQLPWPECLCRRTVRRGVVVNVSLLCVTLLLIALAVVMAVNKPAVIVLVRVPIRAMLPLVHRIIRVVMRDVVVVVRVRYRRVFMFRLIAFALGSLDGRGLMLRHFGASFLAFWQDVITTWRWPSAIQRLQSR